MLTMPRSEAQRRLGERIDKGRTIVARVPNTEAEFNDLQAEYYTWDEYNSELITRMFTSDSFHNDYRSWAVGVSYVDVPWTHLYRSMVEQVESKIRRIASILDRLELVPEAPGVVAVAAPPERTGDNRKVFVVHGHDEPAKLQAARLITKLKFEPIILSEHPNEGRTLIEKFEHHAADVAFAVVFLTDDDLGRAKQESELNARARQNVIFELGFFVGALGRNRVCAVYTPGVELPSDIQGVAWVEMDPKGRWHFEIAREMKAAGLPVDLNLL